MFERAAANFRISGVQFHIWARSINHRFCEVQRRCPRVGYPGRRRNIAIAAIAGRRRAVAGRPSAGGRAIAKILRGYLRDIEQAHRRILKRHATYKKEKLVSIRRDLKLSPGSDVFQQAVDWLDKGDISEELERVGLHIGAMRDLIAGQSADPGKQIEFYSQALLREVNTIAARSRDFEIRQTVVEMKTKIENIENIKEQIRNIC